MVHTTTSRRVANLLERSRAHVFGNKYRVNVPRNTRPDPDKPNPTVNKHRYISNDPHNIDVTQLPKCARNLSTTLPCDREKYKAVVVAHIHRGIAIEMISV